MTPSRRSGMLSLGVGVTWIRLSPKRRRLACVDSGFCRNDGNWRAWIPAFAGKAKRQFLSRQAAVGGWDDTILPTPRRPAGPWSPRSGVPRVARRWAGLPGCCRRERKGPGEPVRSNGTVQVRAWRGGAVSAPISWRRVSWGWAATGPAGHSSTSKRVNKAAKPARSNSTCSIASKYSSKAGSGMLRRRCIDNASSSWRPSIIGPRYRLPSAENMRAEICCAGQSCHSSSPTGSTRQPNSPSAAAAAATVFCTSRSTGANGPSGHQATRSPAGGAISETPVPEPG